LVKVAREPRASGIPPQGRRPLDPSKELDAHACFTKSGQEPDLIANDRERYRRGERISTAVVESMVNRVIGRRMAKKQPMRWSRRGAHLLVQIRVAVLDGCLQDAF
jgi:hypothetical protein